MLMIADGPIFNFQIELATTDAVSTTLDLVQSGPSTTDTPLDLAATDAPAIDTGATTIEWLQTEIISATASLIPQDPSTTDTPLDPTTTGTATDAGATTTADVVLQNPSTTDGSLPTDVPIGDSATTDGASLGVATTTDLALGSACCSSTQETPFWTTVPVINLESFVFNFQNPAATGGPSPQPTDSLLATAVAGDATGYPTVQPTDPLSAVTSTLNANPTDQPTMMDVSFSTVVSQYSAPTDVTPVRRDFDLTVRVVSNWFENLVSGRKSKRQHQREIKSSLLYKRGKSDPPGSASIDAQAPGIPALDPISRKAMPIPAYADKIMVRSNDNTPPKQRPQTLRYQKQPVPPTYLGSASLGNAGQRYDTSKIALQQDPATSLDKPVVVSSQQDSAVPPTTPNKDGQPQGVNRHEPLSDPATILPAEYSGPKNPHIKVVVDPKISGAKGNKKPEVRRVYVPKPKIQLFGRLRQNQRRMEE